MTEVRAHSSGVDSRRKIPPVSPSVGILYHAEIPAIDMTVTVTENLKRFVRGDIITGITGNDGTFGMPLIMLAVIGDRQPDRGVANGYPSDDWRRSTYTCGFRQDRYAVHSSPSSYVPFSPG